MQQYGEKQLIDIYKIRHYNQTRRKVMKTVVFMGLGGCVFGGTLAVLSGFHLLSFLTYVIGTLCIGISGYIYFFKGKTGYAMPLAVSLYFCFVYVPVDWFIYEGVTGSTTYIAIVILVIVVLLLNRMQQKIVMTAYLALLSALTAHSIAESAARSADMSAVIRISSAFLVSAFLISYALMFLLIKYEKMHERFLESSIKDKLTGVFNRHILDEVLSYGETMYQTKKMDYAVAMLDIDRFKALNDRQGHAAGDAVLERFARCVSQSVRATDFVIRYGGDEFLLVLSGATDENVKAIYARIEDAIQNNTELQGVSTITFSRGFAYRSGYGSIDETIAAADKRMYDQKHAC